MSGPRVVSRPRIERFLHRAYETVRSDDLDGQGAAQDALRDWHNRALHRTYGVVFGLDVNLDGDAPTAGALKARVDPGLAYDATGRDVFLRETETSPIPYGLQGMTLVLRFGLPAPALAWVPTSGFRIDQGVPLAKTSDSTTIEDIELSGLEHPEELPPQLRGKVLYDAIRHRLTIRGLLSRPQFDLLAALAPDQATRAEIESAFETWPFEAPRPSHAIESGLGVTVVSGLATGTLWAVRITAGRAVNNRGQVLTLDHDTTWALSGRADERSLILKPPGGPGGLDLVRDPLNVLYKDAVTLATIKEPANAVIDLDSPLRTENAITAALLQTLETKNDKITYDPKGPKITLTGFLTGDEIDQLEQMVSDDLDSVEKVREKLDPGVESNKPRVPPGSEEAERVPLFPPRSRPLARPRTATGSSLPGRSEWKAIPKSAAPGADFEAYETTVDIGAAGFTEIPQLIAWVERLVQRPDGGGQAPPPVPSPPFLGSIIGVPDTRRFVFRLWRVTPAPSADETTEYLRDYVYVRWLGVQSDPLPDWNSWPAPTAG
jgi:hypothetical protein